MTAAVLIFFALTMFGVPVRYAASIGFGIGIVMEVKS